MKGRMPNNPLTIEARLACDQGEIPVEAYQAFRSQVCNAERRAIEFHFTISEWWAWWQTDDRWSRRGVGVNKMVMARIGDKGPYHPNNVKCITHIENIKEIDFVSIGRKHRARWARKTKAERAKWHLAVRGDGHPKSRAVVTPKGRFGSIALASEAYRLTRQGGAARARDRREGWYYESERRKRPHPCPINARCPAL